MVEMVSICQCWTWSGLVLEWRGVMLAGYQAGEAELYWKVYHIWSDFKGRSASSRRAHHKYLTFDSCDTGHEAG